MYRWLILGPVLAFCAVSAVVAYRWSAAFSPGFATPAAFFTLGPSRVDIVSGAPSLTAAALANNFGLLLAGVLLVRLAAFQPGRRYPVWLAGLKDLAALALAGLALLDLAYRGAWSGMTAAVLATQADKPLPVLLVAAWLPQSLPETAALSVVLAAPLFWLIRGIQVRSLPRATFEGWAEVRRLILPAAVLLAAAAALGAWAAPSLVTWVLR